MGILKQAESGVPVSELCREHRMSNASLYKWRAEFGDMDASIISELKAMAEETPEEGQTGRFVGAGCAQSYVVNGFYGRPAG